MVRREISSSISYAASFLTSGQFVPRWAYRSSRPCVGRFRSPSSEERSMISLLAQMLMQPQHIAVKAGDEDFLIPYAVHANPF